MKDSKLDLVEVGIFCSCKEGDVNGVEAAEVPFAFYNRQDDEVVGCDNCSRVIVDEVSIKHEV